MKQRKSGFTLLELLVVVGILAALVALALPFYQDYVNQSKITAAEADIMTFKKALQSYDSLEPQVYSSNDLVDLIGKYLQDYRVTNTQTMPLDPWGVEYQINIQDGSIVSGGPNGSIDSVAGDRFARQDDLLVVWKPPFFVNGVRAVNSTTIEISFSRKVTSFTAATISPARTITGYNKVSDSIYRITLDAATPLVKTTTYTVTATTVTGQDGKTLSGAEFKPDGTTPANQISFTF